MNQIDIENNTINTSCHVSQCFSQTFIIQLQVFQHFMIHENNIKLKKYVVFDPLNRVFSPNAQNQLSTIDHIDQNM